MRQPETGTLQCQLTHTTRSGPTANNDTAETQTEDLHERVHATMRLGSPFTGAGTRLIARREVPRPAILNT